MPPADEPRPAGGERPADAARRALREARRGAAGAPGPGPAGTPCAAPGPDPAPDARPAPGLRPVADTPPADPGRRRGTTEGTTALGSRPGDVAREALRRAAGTPADADRCDASSTPAQAERAEGGSEPAGAGRPDTGPGSTTAGRPGTDTAVTEAGPPGGAFVPADAGRRDTFCAPEETGRTHGVPAPPEDGPAGGPGGDAVPPVTGRAQAPSGVPRPGDVAREALRAARTQAERERTAARASGAGARGHRGGAVPAAPGPRPAASSREAAARVREMAERLGDTFELSSRLEREAQADGPDAGPATTATPVTAPDADITPAPGTWPATLESPSTDNSTDGRTDNPAVRPADNPDNPDSPADSPADSRAADRAVTLPGRSMAAPARDGELRRTFPALSVRPPGAGTGGFAETWWGDAWVAALEETALDPARLGRGKAYAEKGHVDAVTVTPGLVLAYVHGSRPRPYRVQIRTRTLADDDWERFLDAAAERPSHIAALLDRDLPHALADSGVELLPGPGDLVPRCSCPDSGHPCKHAAALCYQTARLLDEDPFVLLLLRGRGERELLDELSRRNATLAARSARAAEEPALPGVPAREAVGRRVLPRLPAPLPPPAHPEQPPAYPASPGGPDPFALDQLATDAAARAHALLTTGRDPLAELTLWQDAVRLAAARPGSGLTATTRAFYGSLATAAGRTPADLARAVAAWRQGGLEGLAVLEEAWDPPAGRFDRARPLLLAADFPAFRPWHNRLTHPRGHIQLRLGHDGLWYAYESEPDHDDWWPRGTPDLDPVGALTGLGSPTGF
nr:SWIM zinc finger family protein [Streptomyces sp. V3I8]